MAHRITGSAQLIPVLRSLIFIFKTGDRRQETGDRRQETRRQETGDQDTEDKGQNLNIF
jgi:hypothetical protein